MQKLNIFNVLLPIDAMDKYNTLEPNQTEPLTHSSSPASHRTKMVRREVTDRFTVNV